MPSETLAYQLGKKTNISFALISQPILQQHKPIKPSLNECFGLISRQRPACFIKRSRSLRDFIGFCSGALRLQPEAFPKASRSRHDRFLNTSRSAPEEESKNSRKI